jgi:DnaJ-class molecular chaperone
MASFEKQNYYERLEVEPSASPFEICHAYRQALQLYGDESTASYSFFPESERKNILILLEEAFATLVDEQARSRYDQNLIDKGMLTEESRFSKVMKSPVPIFSGMQAGQPSFNRALRPNTAGNINLQDILSREVLTGQDLKRIRTELGLSLEQIATRIKVRPALLQCIEADEYDKLPSRFHLKSFLIQYVQCLQIDTASVVEKYLKRVRD